jgi:hypothetical protein
MKVRDLKSRLESSAGRAKINQLLTNVSHWMKLVNESPSGTYAADNMRDIEALEKLAGLGLVAMKKGGGTAILAELTNDGKELYRDFMGLGYYL